MSVREYIGARYVPIFASQPWSSENYYEPLTIVLHQGNSYTSKQYVPAGIAITNTDYWAQTGNYNAQIEAYRAEVLAYADDIAANTEAIGTINDTTIPAIQDDVTSVQSDVSDLSTSITNVETTLTAAIATEETARINADAALSNRVTALENVVEPVPLMLVFGDSWCNFNNHPDWITPVCDELGIDMMNFAQSGSGWTVNGSGTAEIPLTAAEQVEYAYSHMEQDDIARVKYIVICTGINDLASFNSSVSAYCNSGTGAPVGVTAFKNSVASRFPNAIVYGTVNVPFHTWNNNKSAKMFCIEKNFETFVFPGGAVDIIPLRNFNWFLWVERNSYDINGLHPAKIDGLSHCLLATMQGGGADACTYSTGFNVVGNTLSTNFVFAFQNGVLTIYPGTIEGAPANEEVDITSSWGEFYDIMSIDARRVYVGGFNAYNEQDGWYSIISGNNPKVSMRKFSASGTSEYPTSVFVIDYNFADQNKYNA